MTASLLTPDLRRILADLARRLGILERRITPAAAVSPTHTHDGAGSGSTVVGGIAEDGASKAVATGADSVAVGDNTDATAANATAVGAGSAASGAWSLAIGSPATASNVGSTAIGRGAVSTYTNATAIGYSAVTSNSQQIMLGGSGANASKIIQGARNAATNDADLGENQLSFYLDESLDLLFVKAKYSTGTVKTGTVALA